jgi:outer membrane protein assembly factor BamB
MKRLAALFAVLASGNAADWLSVGGDAQGSHWQKHGKYITTANAKDLKLLWKRPLYNALSAPVIMGPTITHRGVRELVFVAGTNDLYAVDADFGTVFWKRHFDTDSKSRCTSAVASTPVIEPGPDEDDTEDDEPGPMRPLYAVASDGRLHTIRVSDGADINEPIDFLPPNAQYSDLNFWAGTVYATTFGGCNGAPDGLWSIDVKKPGAKRRFSKFAGYRVTISPTGKVHSGSTVLDADETGIAALPQALATWQDPDGARWIYASSLYGVRAFKLTGPSGKTKLQPAWTCADMPNFVGPPVVSNGVIFLLSGAGLTALDAATGKQFYSSGLVPSARSPILLSRTGTSASRPTIHSTATASPWNDKIKDMYRLLPLLLIALTIPAQTPTLDKPPQDIDDALRERIKQFYDFHVSRRYRQCEQFISEESKDDFYVMTKPQLDSYRIGNIEYSEHFTKAKVVVVGMMPFLMPGAGPKMMEQPFASFWKFENSVWLWYYNKGVAQDSSSKTKSTAPGEPGSLEQSPELAIAALQSAVKIDRTSIELAGSKPQTVKVTNTLLGPASLSIGSPVGPLDQLGVKATFDKKDLKANETAVLTVTADPNKRTGRLPLEIIVSPTNQVLNLTVTISR